MRLLRHALSLATFFLLSIAVLVFAPKVSAQTCSGTRVINQYACVSSPALCQGYSYKCLYVQHSCSPFIASTCGPAEGACTAMCDGWLPAGPQYCSSTGSQTVSCSSPPTCQFGGTIITCSGGGGSGGSCTEGSQQLTYGCWVNGGSGSNPGPGGSGYGACGGCSGCPGTNQTQCRTDPGGSCVWDPSGCGQGSNNPPPAYVSQYFVPNYASAYPTSAISQTTVGTTIYAVAYPVNDTCTSKVVFSILGGTATWPGPSGNIAMGYWYYNATAPHFWGVAIKPTTPGILIVRATAYTTCPGYEMVWSITDASIFVNPPPQPPTTCITPVPNSPTSTCATSQTAYTSVNWSWLRVPFADTYNLEVRDSNDNVVIANAPHTAASLGCSPTVAAATTCTLPTSLQPGTYHALVTAHSNAGACTPDSAVGRSQDYVLSTCTSTVTMNIEQDPSITGGTKATITGSGPTAQCTTPSSGAAFTGGGAIKAQSISSGATYLGTVTGSTASISNVPNATNDYNITFSPLNNYYCTCPANCTYGTKTVPLNPALKYYVSPVADSWYQTIGGDTGALNTAGTSVADPIPAQFCPISGCDPYFSLPLITGRQDTSGSMILNTGAQADLKSAAGAQHDNVAIPSRYVQESTNPIFKEGYDYFWRLFSMGLTNTTDLGQAGNSMSNASEPNPPPKNGKAYYSVGSMTINTSNWHITGNKQKVIFVNGDLTIKNEIKVDKGSFLAFIVRGDITIDPSVGTLNFAQANDGQVQGMYFAEGKITVESVKDLSKVEKKFVGEGTFAAKGGIILTRDFRYGDNGVQNNSVPATLFIYRPDLLINAPDDMKTPNYTWKEVTP